MFDAGIIIIERPRIAPLFGLQGYRKLTTALKATFAGFVQKDRDNDVGDIYAVAGDVRADESYFVPVVKDGSVVQAFVSEARKVLNRLPDRGRMGIYQLKELNLPAKKAAGRLDPTSDLYRALVEGVKAAHPTSALEIK